jgi:hypothetical protein
MIGEVWIDSTRKLENQAKSLSKDVQAQQISINGVAEYWIGPGPSRQSRLSFNSRSGILNKAINRKTQFFSGSSIAMILPLSDVERALDAIAVGYVFSFGIDRITTFCLSGRPSDLLAAGFNHFLIIIILTSN